MKAKAPARAEAEVNRPLKKVKTGEAKAKARERAVDEAKLRIPQGLEDPNDLLRIVAFLGLLCRSKLPPLNDVLFARLFHASRGRLH